MYTCIDEVRAIGDKDVGLRRINLSDTYFVRYCRVSTSSNLGGRLVLGIRYAIYINRLQRYAAPELCRRSIFGHGGVRPGANY